MRDVLVVGAGPAGSAAAFSLAQAGLDVLLLDRATFPRDKTCGDGLTPRALIALDELGLRDRVTSLGYLLHGVTVRAPHGASTRVSLPSLGASTGYSVVIRRLLLDEEVRSRAVAGGAQFAGGTLVQALVPLPNGVEVHARRGREQITERARFVIVASGAATRLLTDSGILAHPPPVMHAIRTYFEGLRHPIHRLLFTFQSVQLPGYGWVFPSSDSSANVGVVFDRVRWRPSATAVAKDVFHRWVRHPALSLLLSGAEQAGPLRAYPIRTDFRTAPTVHRRTLLVGEAAGLVNPLTGEGIDYALESGLMAGKFVAELIRERAFSDGAAAQWDGVLRGRFGRLFGLSEALRNWLLFAPVLDTLVLLANRRPTLRRLLAEVILGDVASHSSGNPLLKLARAAAGRPPRLLR